MDSFPRFNNKENANNLDDDFFDQLEKPEPVASKEPKWHQEVREIAPFFKDVCDTIAIEKPNRVIFLDGGARVFALPYIKYMREQHALSVRADFIDDDVLRAGELSLDDFDVDGQTFFFIDDVIFKGRNVQAIKTLSEKYNFTYQYFSLSTHPGNYDNKNDSVEHVTKNLYSGGYLRGALHGSTTNALYFEHAPDQADLRDKIQTYQAMLLEKMLSE